MKKIVGKGFYFITDRSLSRKGNVEDVKRALRAGVAAVQYRNKTTDLVAMVPEATEIKKLCDRASVPFIVNDSLEVALAADADGLHIGQGDIAYREAREGFGSEKIIGVSVGSVGEALQAQKMGADYLGVGPIFQTATKCDAGMPCGVKLIGEIKKVCHLPLIAIGGINLENASSVIAAGADGLCAISAVVDSNNVEEKIQKFNKLFEVHS
jgi:thiamine-phosphate pyrophosphorylase